MQPKKETQPTTLISDSFGNTKEKGTYEIAFRRWLVQEIEAQRMTVGSAVERFNLPPNSAPALIHHWRKKYSNEIPLTLPLMTEKERQKLEALQKQLKAL